VSGLGLLQIEIGSMARRNQRRTNQTHGHKNIRQQATDRHKRAENREKIGIGGGDDINHISM
jgi:hypothetical protein